MLKRATDRIGFGDPPASDTARDSGDLNLLRYIDIARRRGPLIAAIGLVAGLVGAVYALQLSPQYTASAMLLIDPGQAGGLSPDQGFGSYIDSGKIDSELAVISSTSVAKRVVEKLKLPDPLDAPPAAPSVFSLLTGHLKSLVAGETQKPEPEATQYLDPRDRLALQVQGNVAVKRVGFSYLISVSSTSENPALAAAIANGFADEYLVDQLESRYEATRRTNEWLSGRLGDLRDKVRESERAVEVFKAENNIVESGGATLGDQEVSKLNEQLILARAETAQARANAEQLSAAMKRGADVSSFADVAQSAAIGALRGKASEVRRELAELTVKYGTRHPSVVALRAQLGDITGQIQSESARTVAAAENKYRVAQSRETSIEESLGKLTRNMNLTNQAEITRRELEREATANRALYESFLSKFKEATQEETLKQSTARIIERARTPRAPSAPNRSRIAFMGLFMGLALGGALAFLLEQMDSGFRTSKQAEQILGVPVLASVPKADSEVRLGFLSRTAAQFDFVTPLLRLLWRRKSIESGYAKRMRAAMSRLVVDKPLSTFTEAIRAVRMGIKFADIDHPRKVILVSSALPGEGKSTIASNLACHAALSGERVVLVDMDLRHPVLSGLYAPYAKKGLVDVALGEAELKDVLVLDKATGLNFIPAPASSGITLTAELLGSKRVKEILARLSESFDLVIVDTSPLLPVTDGRALLDSVDGLVLVVKWEETKRDAVAAALSACYNLEEKFIGTVLSQVVGSRARYYDYYKSGYYMKKYPDYYGGKG